MFCVLWSYNYGSYSFSKIFCDYSEKFDVFRKKIAAKLAFRWSEKLLCRTCLIIFETNIFILRITPAIFMTKLQQLCETDCFCWTYISKILFPGNGKLGPINTSTLSLLPPPFLPPPLAPPTHPSPPFGKIAVTFEPVMQFGCPLKFRIS